MKKLTAILTSLIMTLSVICQTSVFAAFSDVGDDNTYKDAITTLTKLKVIDGYEDGTFKPDGQITRAEFTKLIVFILGYKDLAYDSSDFTDVDASHWAKNYIQTAYNLGIIAGMGDGTFAPFQTLDGLKNALHDMNPSITRFDCSCFDGEYVTGTVTEEYLARIGGANAKPAKKADDEDEGEAEQPVS